MSIKQVGQITDSNGTGLRKKINVGSEKLVIDVLQATQYSTPIPSTIRELVTNACDSQREKEIAIEILSGEKTKEDYFINRDGEEYTDSNFNPDYYNLDYLDREENKVQITYKESDEGTGFCDTVEILDHGVGIGGRRLEGMLELGYSTKRNTVENFGAFGFGSKVALSTGVPYYTIETAYNGKLFKMNCYPYKTDFVISKWDSDGSIELSNGDKAYYKSTDSKNYTKISFGVKKHNRMAFNSAVNEQLMYFSNVGYVYIYNDGYSINRKSNVEILLNTDNFIVTSGAYYSRPHIVIVKNPGDEIGINYGNIDFRELELEDLWGNVGIKCPIRQAYIDPDTNEEVVIRDGVDVTPSREKVIWNEHTKKYVLSMMDKAAEEATDIVSDALETDDLIEWACLCAKIMNPKSNDETKNAVHEIARMIDNKKIKPKFKDTGIQFMSPHALLPGYRIRRVFRYGLKTKVSRVDVTSWNDVNFDRLYFTSGSANMYRDMYLTETEEFTLISRSNSDLNANELLRNQKVSPYLLDSPALSSYDDVELPKNYEENVGITNNENIEELTPEELRKLEDRTVVYSLRNFQYKGYVWDKVEPKLDVLKNSTTLTFYGGKEDSHKIKLAGLMLSNRIPKYDSFHFNTSVFFYDETPSYNKNNIHVMKSKDNEYSHPQVVRLSVANIKYAKSNPNWRHIDEFFFSMDKDGNIKVSEYLKVALTSIKLSQISDSLVPSWGGSEYAKTVLGLYNNYQTVREYYYEGNYHIYDLKVDDPDREDLVFFNTYLNNFIKYYDICKTGDEELKKQKSKDFFGVYVPSIEAYDEDVIEIMEYLKDMSEGVESYFDMLSSPLNNLRGEKYHNIILKEFGKFDITPPVKDCPKILFTCKPKHNG